MSYHDSVANEKLGDVHRELPGADCVSDCVQVVELYCDGDKIVMLHQKARQHNMNIDGLMLYTILRKLENMGDKG